MKIVAPTILVCAACGLISPAAADTVSLGPTQSGSQRPTVIGSAWAPERPQVDATAPLVDLAIGFGGEQSPAGSDMPVEEGGPVDAGMITQLGGLGGGSGGSQIGLGMGTTVGGGMTAVQTEDDKTDPASLPIPLPGPASMGLAGLFGVAVLNGRRRR